MQGWPFGVNLQGIKERDGWSLAGETVPLYCLGAIMLPMVYYSPDPTLWSVVASYDMSTSPQFPCNDEEKMVEQAKVVADRRIAIVKRRRLDGV